MASFNKITVVGFLGRDPVLRYTPQGTAVCDFSIATTEKRGDQEVTTWFKVTVWGKQAEVANQYLAKGKQVYVEGRLRQTEYTDREGMKRSSLEVTASDIHFLGSNGGERPANAAPAAQSRPAAANATPPEEPPSAPPSDDDIPF